MSAAPSDCAESSPAMGFQSSPEMERFLCGRLLDAAQPIAERFRALFSLRNLRGDGPRQALLQVSVAPSDCAESSPAMGFESSPEMERFLCGRLLDAAQPIAERFRALFSLRNLRGDGPRLALLQGLLSHRELLLSEKEKMYERYAALFALRNDGGDYAVSAIVEALGVKSALLRHEVAYVLGQLQNKAASDALSGVLKNVDEHPMVRHEAAEALGSIADQESVALLEEFSKDPEPIVSQSCEVALSMLEYERSGKSFEFLFLQTPQVQQES